MPYYLPDGFPHNLSDKEAEKALTSLVDVLQERYGDEVGGWLPELQLALVAVSLSDQSRRQLIKGGRIAFASLLVALAAVVVAVVAVIVSN
jgi:hypothetical protein